VPFPRETESLLSDTASNSSDNNEPFEDQTCLYGSCGIEQRQRCAGLLRKYNTAVVSIPDDDSVKGDNRESRKVKDDYQSNRFMLMLVLCQVSMFMVRLINIWFGLWFLMPLSTIFQFNKLISLLW
jgi:hypothetical protein